MKNFLRLHDYVVLGCLLLTIFSALAFILIAQSSQDQNEATATLNLTANYTADYKSQNRDKVCEDHLTLTYGGAARYKLLPSGYGTSNEHPEILSTYPRAGLQTDRTGGFTVNVQGSGSCNSANGGKTTWTYGARYNAVLPKYFPSIGVQLRPGKYAVGYDFPKDAISVQGRILPGRRDFGSPGGSALGKGRNPLDTQQRPNPVGGAPPSIPYQADGPAMFPLVAVMQQSIPKVSAALNGTFEPYSKEFSRSNSASDTFQMPTNKDGQTGTASLNISYTLTVGNPEEVEAVIIPPDNYDQWTPEAGNDENSPGNPLVVRVVLQKKGQEGKKPSATAQFKFELVGTSQEPGVCLNWPSKNKAKTDFDLQIDHDPNLKLHVDQNSKGQSASSDSGLRESTVTVVSHDWGGWGKLQVTAILDDKAHTQIGAHLKGMPGKEALSIPKDDNGNHIADAWEQEMGLVGSPAALSDDDDQPDGDGHTGDGLSLFEEYRGFRTHGDSGRIDHVRTDPLIKDLFVCDHDNLGIGNFGASVLSVHLVRSGEYASVPVSDPVYQNSRIINFNQGYAHLGDAHVILLMDGPAMGRLGVTIGGPGVPKKIAGILVDRAACMGSRWKALEVYTNIAHELGHATNVQHHGDTNIQGIELWKQAAGKWYPMGVEQWMVAMSGGENSGVQNCIMRYYRANYYVSPGGDYRWRSLGKNETPTGGYTIGKAYGPAEMPGMIFDDEQTATGVNAPPVSKAGSAIRGHCRRQFCVNDLKH